MKKTIKFGSIAVLFTVFISSMTSCKEQPETAKELALNSETPEMATLAKKPISEEFKKYWYAGDAEITSYKLEQARYGEVREGNAVLIYVTEPFVKGKQVKADRSYPDNIPVLKLNSTKKYLTGIYPYSIMNSSFYPVADNQHALKVSFSAQEWCGHVFAQLNNKNVIVLQIYPVADNQHALKVSFSAQEWCGHVFAQLNNKDKFEVQSRSYFESEGDTNTNIDKAILENELWNKIRISPETLPVGEIKIIPSLEFVRMSHGELKAYNATASLTSEKGMQTYTITYPELERTLAINFTAAFPYVIESWTDTFKGGFGSNAKILTSTATKIKTLKLPYWSQNRNKHLPLRDSLGL